MKRIKILPKSQRAKNRIREHGEIMEFIREQPGKFFVHSLENTYGDDRWWGWFTTDEASYDVES